MTTTRHARNLLATRMVRLAALACLLFAATAAQAQMYPAEPVRLIVPSLYASLPYEPLRDFAPVAHVADSTNLLVIGMTVPAKDAREQIAPDLPTVAESGLPGFASDICFGLLAPAGTPKAIVDNLNADTNRVLA